MTFDQKLRAMAANVANVRAALGPSTAWSTSAITHALVMPWLAALGYPPFDARVVTRVDGLGWLVGDAGRARFLIEVRAVDDALLGGPSPALAHALASSGARVAIVTNGVLYRLFADIERRGRLDAEPFMDFDLLDVDAAALAWLARLGEPGFDLDGLLSAAQARGRPLGDAALEATIIAMFANPDAELIELIGRRLAPETGSASPRPGLTRAVARVLARFEIRSEAVDAPELARVDISSEVPAANEVIVTTDEELDGYAIVRELVGDILPLERLSYRDRERFFGIIVDGDERQTLCRLHFNRVRKYIGIFEAPTQERKHHVASVESINLLREPLRAAARRWLAPPEGEA